MTSQQQLVQDNSTLANFKQWAQAVSAFFSTAGWVQTSDTGQVNWSTISTVPGANAFVYEVWKPGDALAAFYLKVEYGNTASGTNYPSMRLTIGTGTNGAGTLTGYVTQASLTSLNQIGAGSTQYECDFSGDAGRMHVMLWRNNNPFVFSVERSVNSSGVYTGSHVTLITVGFGGNSNAYNGVNQQSILFGVGAAPAVSVMGGTGGTTTFGGLAVRLVRCGWSGASGAFNGAMGFDPVAPYVGYWDYPLTGLGAGQQPDFTEGVTFQVTLYGATRTYMPAKGGSNTVGIAGPNNSPICLFMRYD